MCGGSRDHSTGLELNWPWPVMLRHTRSMGVAVSSGPAILSRKLRYRAPYDWESFLSFVRPRAIPGLEEVDSDSYSRLGVKVRRAAKGDCLMAHLDLHSRDSLQRTLEQAGRFFDLRANTAEIGAALMKSRLLRPIVKRHPGLRVPGCWDGFELAVRALLGQQVTVKGATTLAGRLVSRFGAPRAEILAEADLAPIGLPKARAAAICGFARAVCEGRIRFDDPLSSGVSSAQMIGRMCELPGIGPWTANYIAMRAMGDPDAFPASDLGLLKAAGIASARRLEEVAESWRPWRAYAAMYLWRTLG